MGVTQVINDIDIDIDIDIADMTQKLNAVLELVNCTVKYYDSTQQFTVIDSNVDKSFIFDNPHSLLGYAAGTMYTLSVKFHPDNSGREKVKSHPANACCVKVDTEI